MSTNPNAKFWLKAINATYKGTVGAEPKKRAHANNFLFVNMFLTPPGPGIPIPLGFATGLPVTFPRGAPVRPISL